MEEVVLDYIGRHCLVFFLLLAFFPSMVATISGIPCCRSFDSFVCTRSPLTEDSFGSPDANSISEEIWDLTWTPGTTYGTKLLDSHVMVFLFVEHQGRLIFFRVASISVFLDINFQARLSCVLFFRRQINLAHHVHRCD